MLVWGAWRDALGRALDAHRRTRAELDRLTAQLTQLDADPGLTGSVGPADPLLGEPSPADQAGRRVLAAVADVAAAARGLPGGWRTDPWPALTAAVGPDSASPSRDQEVKLLDHDEVLDHGGLLGPVRIRIGTVRTGGGSGRDAGPDGVPLHVPLLGQAHLAVDAEVRDARVAALFQTVLLRVLAGMPPGRVRIIAYDPAGLGRVFAPLRPLAAAGVLREVAAGREGLLEALDEADARVHQAWQQPDLGRPRDGDRPLLVLALTGLPTGASTDLEARLAALAHAGPAAGVSLLLAQWPPRRPAGYEQPPALEATSQLTATGPSWTATLAGLPTSRRIWVELDPPPPAALIGRVAERIGAALAEQSRLTFAELLSDQVWADSSVTGLGTPIGRAETGAATVRFDDATPHWLVGGRSGAGKTVFLLDLLAGLTVRYSPDELELYLLDFKEGVSFTEFTPTPRDPTWIPHAVAVGVESDREYGVAVLRALRAVMSRRATEFKRAGVTGLAQLRRELPQARLPRVLAVIDEFQVLFTGNDALARQATELLEEIARKGRSYGVHLVLASQTASGIEALQTKMEAIFGQFPMRIALAGGGGVLDPLNPAADGLPIGTAVVNPSAGIPGANTVVRLPFADPESLTRLRRRLWERRPKGSRPPAVFAGYAEQHPDDDPTFRALAPGGVRRSLLLGRRIDVGSPTASVPLDPTPGRHLGVLGPDPQGADVLAAALAGLGRQHLPGSATFLIAPLVEAGDVAAQGALALLAAAGHQPRTVPLDRLGATLAELATFPGPGGSGPRQPTYLALFGADAAGPALGAVSTETFRSGLDDLRAVVQQGPVHGVHVLGWWRTLARFAADVGPTAREDVACLLVLNLPGSELAGFLGQFDLQYSARPNRALLIDRHENRAEPVVPYSRAVVTTGQPTGR
jgi:hypothetical protein